MYQGWVNVLLIKVKPCVLKDIIYQVVTIVIVGHKSLGVDEEQCVIFFKCITEYFLMRSSFIYFICLQNC